MRRPIMLALVGGALLAAAPGALAQDAAPQLQEDSPPPQAALSPPAQAALEFVGTPSVRYAKVVTDEGRRYWSLAAVVRLSVPIEPAATGFPVAPGLATGDQIGEVFGGGPPDAVGVRSTYCYSVELQRPQPVATPSEGARWRVGVSQGDTIRDTTAVTLKTERGAGDWQQQAQQRLGCDAAGERVRVGVEELEVNDRPNEDSLGSLQPPQTFKVRKLSASGKYAYGLAYGDVNKVGWVLTSGLGPRD